MQKDWDKLDRALDAIERGEDASQAASAVGLDAATLAQLTMLSKVLDHRQRRRTRRARTVAIGVGAVVLSAVVALVAGPAVAQVACSQSLPAPLVTFCPNNPAVATEINGNFGQLVTWMQQKVGPVGSTNIVTAGTVTAAAVTAASVTATGNVTAGQNLEAARAVIGAGTIQRGGGLITATSDLGLYSRVAGNYVRLVANNGPIKMFTQEGANGAGGAVAFSVEPDGALTHAYNGEPEGTLALPPSFCVISPLNQACPTNWDQRQVKWDTEDSSNGDFGKDGIIAVDNGNTASVLMRFCCRGAGW